MHSNLLSQYVRSVINGDNQTIRPWERRWTNRRYYNPRAVWISKRGHAIKIISKPIDIRIADNEFDTAYHMALYHYRTNYWVTQSELDRIDYDYRYIEGIEMYNTRMMQQRSINYSMIDTYYNIDQIPQLACNVDTMFANRTGYPTDPIKPIDDVIDRVAEINQLMILYGTNCPHYNGANPHIVVPAIDQYKSAYQYYSTIFHEIGHHYDGMIGSRCSDLNAKCRYAYDEVVAECFANIVCNKLSIANDQINNDSVSYINAYVKDCKTRRYDYRKLVITRGYRRAQRLAKIMLDVCG